MHAVVLENTLHKALQSRACEKVVLGALEAGNLPTLRRPGWTGCEVHSKMD